jgi:hypothetical protein
VRTFERRRLSRAVNAWTSEPPVLSARSALSANVALGRCWPLSTFET